MSTVVKPRARLPSRDPRLARIIHSLRVVPGFRGCVAQVSNLLYRRLPVGRLYLLGRIRGLEIRGIPAGREKSALRLPVRETREKSGLVRRRARTCRAAERPEGTGRQPGRPRRRDGQETSPQPAETANTANTGNRPLPLPPPIMPKPSRMVATQSGGSNAQEPIQDNLDSTLPALWRLAKREPGAFPQTTPLCCNWPTCSQAPNNFFSALFPSLRFHCLSEGLHGLPNQSRRPSATLSRSTLHAPHFGCALAAQCPLRSLRSPRQKSLDSAKAQTRKSHEP
jgi:hypothetical protein